MLRYVRPEEDGPSVPLRRNTAGSGPYAKHLGIVALCGLLGTGAGLSIAQRLSAPKPAIVRSTANSRPTASAPQTRGSDIDPRLESLSQAIVETETAQSALRSQAGRKADYDAAAHRAQLLRLSYEGKLTVLSPELRAKAESDLSQRETMAGIATGPSAVLPVDTESSAAKPPGTSPLRGRTFWGTGGFAFGSFFAFSLLFFRNHNRVEDHAVEAGQSLASVESESNSEDSFRDLAFSILLEDWGRGIRIYTVAGAHPGEGRTTLTANLGIALADAGLRVALVDGDIRNPALHRHFGLDQSFGVRDILRGGSDANSLPLEGLAKETPFRELFVVPSGKDRGATEEPLHTQAFRRLLQRLKTEFDIILVDTPALLGSGTADIAACGESAILILCNDRTLHDPSFTTLDGLRRHGVRTDGALLQDAHKTREAA